MRCFASLLLVLAACDGSFHFRSPDASADSQDAATSEDASKSLCGQVASCPCTGNVCTCSSLQSCDFSGEGCGESSGTCGLACSSGNTCQGQCQTGCQLVCSGASLCQLTMGSSASASCRGHGVTCALTVGPSSVVQCQEGATCAVTCTGSCQVLCLAEVSDDGELEAQPVCRYRCAGETAFRTGGGSCTK